MIFINLSNHKSVNWDQNQTNEALKYGSILDMDFKSTTIAVMLGVLLAGVIMMVVRGITEVLGTPLTKVASAAISGIAGIGHIILSAGIILLIISLKKVAKKQE